MGLRKPNNFVGVHYGVINVGDSCNAIWQTVKEYNPPLPIEIIRKPNIDLTGDLKNATNNTSFMNTLSSFKISLNEFEEIEKLNVAIILT